MPKDPKKAGGDADDAESEDDRPTGAPPFDPVAFAREVLDAPSRAPKGPEQGQRASGQPTAKPPPQSKKPESAITAKPPVDRPPPRFETPTAHPPPPPEPRRPGSIRKATPTSTLSLANMRAPSVPPPVTKRASGETSTSPPGGKSPEELAREAAPKSEGPPTPQEMSDRVSLGDYTGALVIAEKLLEADPDDAAALSCAENCRAVLRQMYSARIGPLDRVPVVMVPRDQLRWLSIDHRAGFVLSLVDGVSSVEMILDVSGMQELDALRILSELAQQRIIQFR